jgi:Na+/melibiose symporter-like transporter
LASVIPVVLVESVGARSGYQSFAWIFSLILLVCVCVTLLWSPRPERHDLKQGSNWKKALEDHSVRRIFFFYLLNAISVAIPATLVLFFIDDVVQRPQDAGIFLAAYFVAGIVTLPGWVALADRIGKRFAWLIGSGIAAAALAGASAVGAGDVLLYGLVCVAAGTALGADLALPASMLADAIPSAQRQNTGLYIGVWVLIGKLALAVAAGLTLPTLSFFDYQPGVPASVAPLITLYVFLPIVFKFAAAAVLILFVSPARANP